MMGLHVLIVLIHSKFLMSIQKDVQHVIRQKFITTPSINAFQEIEYTFQLMKKD